MKQISILEFEKLQPHCEVGPRFGKFCIMTEGEKEQIKLGDTVRYLEVLQGPVPKIKVVTAILIE